MGETLLRRSAIILLVLVVASIGDRQWFRIEYAMAAVRDQDAAKDGRLQETTSIETACMPRKKLRINFNRPLFLVEHTPPVVVQPFAL